MLSTLRDNSQRRGTTDPKVQELQKESDRYRARKNRKAIPLNEDTLRQERQAEKAEEDIAKEEQERESGTKKGPIYSVSEYNNEALHIALDYVILLTDAKTAKK